MLFAKDTPGENIVVRGARIIDPVVGVDAVLDVRLDDGVIAALGQNLDTNSHRVIDGEGLVLTPAFVDPHVHLRTPGREDEETIASGTAAAAAGGYCAILAMPNTDPVVDSAATLGSLIEIARGEAAIPVGFLAAITRGQSGAELKEMGELADAGAAGFSDDGVPVAAPGLMRRALRYGAVTGKRIALHCEERTLSRDGQMHEGSVSVHDRRVLADLDLDRLLHRFQPPSRASTLQTGLPEGSGGIAESDRRARSNSAQPVKQGPGARLSNGLQCQRNDGVGRAAPPQFSRPRGAPTGTR